MSPLFERRRVRDNFARAAQGYADVAVLQREVEDRLLEQLDHLRVPPTRVLDVGAGTGRGAALIKQRWPKAEVIALDAALPMLREVKKRARLFRPLRRVCGDASALPLADASVDLIVSNLCLQWVDDLPATLDGFRRVLRPDGFLLFSTFGPDTLVELREAFGAADAVPHVSPFAAIQQVGDALMAAGFRDPVLDRDLFTLTYPDAFALMRELRAMGAGNALDTRRRSLTGRQRMQAMVAAYDTLRRADGRLPASWDVIYAHAWGPKPGQPRRADDGGQIASFPVSGLRIRRRPASD